MLDRIAGSIYGRSRSVHYRHRYLTYCNRDEVHTSFGFNGTDIRLYGDGEIFLGKKSYMGTNATLQSAEGCKVVIGKRCQISHNVRIYTASADPNQDFTKEKVKPNKLGDVIIGNGVWIRANVFINPNITIGNNTVVGANSVVTKDIPDNAIYGGVPARLIKYKRFE